MIDIKLYIELPVSDRQLHLDMSDACIERGGNSTNFKGLLAEFLKTTIPSGHKILLCHKCNNAKCSNPKHLYFGTPKENVNDSKENGTWKSVWERSIEKYGYAEACRRNGSGDKSAGGRGNKGKFKSDEHKKKISHALKAKRMAG